jgi:hypothetical protein
MRMKYGDIEEINGTIYAKTKPFLKRIEHTEGNFTPKKVIYNPPATIVIWNDDTKTIVKTTDGEQFDPERGYLQAYYEKHNNMSKTQGNKILHDLRKQYEEEE